MKLEEHICKKGLCQPFSHKFLQRNIVEIFINLILHDWMTPLNEFSNLIPSLWLNLDGLYFYFISKSKSKFKIKRQKMAWPPANHWLRPCTTLNCGKNCYFFCNLNLRRIEISRNIAWLQFLFLVTLLFTLISFYLFILFDNFLFYFILFNCWDLS